MRDAKIGLYDIVTSTTLESNKSLSCSTWSRMWRCGLSGEMPDQGDLRCIFSGTGAVLTVKVTVLFESDSVCLRIYSLTWGYRRCLRAIRVSIVLNNTPTSSPLSCLGRLSRTIPCIWACSSSGKSAIFQIPPDLVVKSQTVDIVEVI